jgi:hypothetical protein
MGFTCKSARCKSRYKMSTESLPTITPSRPQFIQAPPQSLLILISSLRRNRLSPLLNKDSTPNMLCKTIYTAIVLAFAATVAAHPAPEANAATTTLEDVQLSVTRPLQARASGGSLCCQACGCSPEMTCTCTGCHYC